MSHPRPHRTLPFAVETVPRPVHQPSDDRRAPTGARRDHDVVSRAPDDADATEDTLGTRVARLREAAGLSQAQLAQRTGVSQSAISLIEAGSNPRADTLRRVALALGVAVADLFGEDAAPGLGLSPEDVAFAREFAHAPPEVKAQLRTYFRFVQTQRRDAA